MQIQFVSSNYVYVDSIRDKSYENCYAIQSDLTYSEETSRLADNIYFMMS